MSVFNDNSSGIGAIGMDASNLNPDLEQMEMGHGKACGKKNPKDKDPTLSKEQEG
jgi:hypothetical protein